MTLVPLRVPLRRSLSALIMFCCWQTFAHSTLVTHSFGGLITDPGPLNPPFLQGTAFTGSFTYDLATPPDLAIDGAARYRALTRFSFDLQGYSISFSGGARIDVVDGTIVGGSDRLQIEPISPLLGQSINGFRPDSAGLLLEDASASTFDGAALPSSLSLDDFDAALISVSFVLDQGPISIGLLATGTLTALTPEPNGAVEPATLTLCLLGFLGLALHRRLGSPQFP
jgi:hypothetical protein